MANLLKIKELARLRNISLKQLAEDVGISEQALHQLMRKNTTAIATLEAIATKLEVAPSVFFDGAGDIIGGNVANHGTIHDERHIKNVNNQAIDKALELLSRQLDTKDTQIASLLDIIKNHGH